MPENIQVSQVFIGNTEVLSLSNNKMMLIKLPQLRDTYDTEIYGINRVNGVLYAAYLVGMKRLGIRGRIEKEGTPPVMPKPLQSTLLSRVAPHPQATSTPAVGAAPIDLSRTVTNENYCISPKE